MGSNVGGRLCGGILGLALIWTALADDRPAPAAAADAETSPQVVEVVLSAPLVEVWKVFSTAGGFKRLGVAQCEMDFRIGGSIRAHYDPAGTLGDEGTIEHEILAFEPERMIAFRLRKAPKDFPFSEDTWKRTWSVATFRDLGNGKTHVRLAGLGYTSSEESRKMRAVFASANAWVMQNLQKQFESAGGDAGRAADPLAPISHERVVELPRGDVWRLFATPAGWRQFMEPEATIELRPGGRFEVLFDPAAPTGQRGSEGCRVLSFVPEEMLSYTWSAPPRFGHARAERTWVVVRFEKLAPARTLVRLDHLGFAEMVSEHPGDREEWAAVRTYFERAWGGVLDALKAQEALDDAASQSSSTLG